MATQAGAGTTLSISATLPTTHDVAGFGAISDAVEVGEVTNIGEFGKQFELVTHQPLATRSTEKNKGGFNLGQLSPTIALDPGNAGQVIMDQALESDNNYTFVVTLVTGHRFFMTGLVMNFRPTIGGQNDVVNYTTTIELTGVSIVRIDP